jgi:ferredoxin--NADP+ reductase
MNASAVNEGGTVPTPLRVAVVGSGPSGFYVVQALLQAKVPVRIDVFDRLPAPYGLVRYGVAPDHQKIKTVTKVYSRLASDPSVRFFGNVEFGKDLTLDDLRRHYHQVAFCTGAQTDRRLGIPGEDLVGSHPATEFVAWYNGHPEFRHLTFDLSCERAAVVGVGNVAIDVARILCRTPDELAKTDIADHALEALRHSRVREVMLLGRRGPAQAAFTNHELEEVGELEGADAVTLPEEVDVDEVTKADLAEHPDRQTEHKVELLRSYARTPAVPKPKRLTLRFLVSPVEILGDAAGKVRGLVVVHNVLSRGSDGQIKAKPTDRKETLDVGLVFRSVGYRGVALPGIPFREDWGTVPHVCGRVVDKPDGAPVLGCYAAGWFKRGPSGVIGTNRPCSAETAHQMLEDARAGKTWTPSDPDPEAVVRFLGAKKVRSMSFAEWSEVDAVEVARGEPLGRPRVKFQDAASMFSALRPKDAPRRA